MFNNQNILDRNFEEVFLEYMQYKKDKIKITTFYDISKLAENHIIPCFSNRKIGEITKQDILSWQMNLSNYGFKYKCKIRVTLYSFYKYLFYYYDVENIVAKVEAFTKPNTKKEMNFWTLEDFNRFIATTDDNVTYKTFFTLLYYTGCRIGEVLALNFNDINFSEENIDICKSLTNKIYKEENSLPYAIVSPKNQASFRKIKMPNILIYQLQQYINEIPNIENQTFLFGGEKPLNDHTIYRYLNKHCTLAGVKKIRIHDFRHSHASLLIQNGANVVLVARRLGHSSIEQTLNTYTHLFPNSEQELIDKLNAL